MTLLSGTPARQILLAVTATVAVLGVSCSGDSVAPESGGPTDSAIPAYGYPTWNPDGRIIGFNHRPLVQIRVDPSSGAHTYEFNDSMSGFWVINSDGSNMHRLLPFFLESPRWNSDGSWIVFGRSGQIWKGKYSGDSIAMSSLTQITSDPSGATSPDWTTDGNRVIYSSTGGTRAGLWMTTSDGVGQRRIGELGWKRPDWSPLENRILFTGQIGNQYGLATCDTLGLGAITLGIESADYSSWSSDGTLIAYVQRPIGRSNVYYNLWIAGAVGEVKRQLTTDGAGLGLSWAPDGSEIVYIRFSPTEHTEQNGTLWVVNTQTLARRQLTTNP